MEENKSKRLILVSNRLPFQLQEIDENKTRLIHGEKFSGLLATPILWLIKNSTIAGFELMNRCLGERVRKSYCSP